MPKMVVTHTVLDVDNWLKGKAERADAISAMGCSNVVDYVAADGSKAIAVTADAHDPAAVVAAISSPPAELVAAMDRHGVVPPLTIYIEK
jgi:protein-L-isoaspartate O-methyltransferase